MNTRNRDIYKQWMDIQDIVGPAKLWPLFIRRLFWTQSLNLDYNICLYQWNKSYDFHEMG